MRCNSILNSVADGRIHYSQMCDVLELHDADFSKNQDLVSGLEWEDPLRVNRIADCEQRRLCQLIVKIAMQVKLRDICLRYKKHKTLILIQFSNIIKGYTFKLKYTIAIYVKEYRFKSEWIGHVGLIRRTSRFVFWDFDKTLHADTIDSVKEFF